MPEQLGVWFGEKRVGTLTRSGKLGLRFAYDEGWIANGFALSRSLPLKDGDFDAEISKTFFDNLLPEQAIRETVSQRIHVSPKNVFGFLETMGGECAGALTILPADVRPSGEYKYEPVLLDKLSDLIALLPKRPLLAGADGIRISLAGAQHKIPLAYIDGGFYLPQNNSPTTHILKPPIDDLPESVENETFCMALAQMAGLRVPPVQITETAPRAYLVERYDRVVTHDAIRRLHQEDFCQALGVPADNKYQNDGGPTTEECFALLENCADPAGDTEQFFKAMVFNHLIGNTDAHAKNFSLLYENPPTPRLAPFYDLLCLSVYDGLSTKNAMKIGGQYDPQFIQRRHWERLGELAGVNKHQAVAEVIDMARELHLFVPILAATFQETYGKSRMVPKISRFVQSRCAQTLERLDSHPQ